MNYRMDKVLMLMLLITACSESPPESGETARQESSAVTEAADTPMTINKDEKVDEVKAFIENGATVLASERGDLDRDGNQDVVLVLDHPKVGEDKLAEGARRSLVLLVRDDAGQLHRAGQNDTIVPCAKCGGMAGDPFSYVRVEKGVFTVLVEGGSRERWFDEYVFGYSVEGKGWFLDKVIHGVTDTITGEAKQTELTQEDFGMIEFDKFDPSKLPLVEGA